MCKKSQKWESSLVFAQKIDFYWFKHGKPDFDIAKFLDIRTLRHWYARNIQIDTIKRIIDTE